MGVIEKIPAYVEKFPGGSIITTTTDWVFNTARSNSVWYMLFGLACCAIEMMATGASRYDFDRYGMIYRASPRQSDLIILAGTMTLKMGPRIKMLYDQMPEPKYALSMGGCTIYGGPFYYDTYSLLKGGDKIIPIDVFVPGCPPRPEALMEGMLKLREKIQKDSIKRLAVKR